MCAGKGRDGTQRLEDIQLISMEVGQSAHCVSPWSELVSIKGMKMKVFPQCLSSATAEGGGGGESAAKSI